MRLKQRLEALEGAGKLGMVHPVAWIIRQNGETREEAIDRHSAKHGPITGGTIIWSMMAPEQRAACV